MKHYNFLSVLILLVHCITPSYGEASAAGDQAAITHSIPFERGDSFALIVKNRPDDAYKVLSAFDLRNVAGQNMMFTFDPEIRGNVVYVGFNMRLTDSEPIIAGTTGVGGDFPLGKGKSYCVENELQQKGVLKVKIVNQGVDESQVEFRIICGTFDEVAKRLEKLLPADERQAWSVPSSDAYPCSN